MNDERFNAWTLVRLRGRGPYGGSAWRAAAHIYRERAINCMLAMRSFQQSIRVWENAYSELEERNKAQAEEIERLKETIEHYQADVANNYKLMALYQEQRDEWMRIAQERTEGYSE